MAVETSSSLVSPPLAPSSSDAVAGSKPLIMCVDDEPYILSALGRVLAERYEVHTSALADEALTLMTASRRPYAIVLCDMRMPGMSGLAFLTTARVAWPSTIRILLTGDVDASVARAALADGTIYQCLSKPCPNAKLRETLELALQQYMLSNTAWLVAA